MSYFLDLESWPRRAAFEFFRSCDNPYFNVCAPLEVTCLLRLCKCAEEVSFSLASIYLALRTANECESFRYRLQGGRVLVHDRIHAGTTHLIGEERLAFVYFDYHEHYANFREHAEESKRAVAAIADVIDAQADRGDLIHFSSLPWVSLTSFTNARNWGREDSVPKITFGKYQQVGDQVSMPVSVEVHHALMDGFQVGVPARPQELGISIGRSSRSSTSSRIPPSPGPWIGALRSTSGSIGSAPNSRRSPQ